LVFDRRKLPAAAAEVNENDACVTFLASLA